MIDDIQSQMEDLRYQCELRGIKVHHKFSAEKLASLINEHDNVSAATSQAIDSGRELTPAEKLEKLRKDSMRLRRVMVTCNDPAKVAYRGEIFQAANSGMAIVRKFVPFGNTNGWFVPQILINVIEEKQFRRTNTNERDARSGGLVKAYNVTYLDDLTPQEFEMLKQQQEQRKLQGLL